MSRKRDQPPDKGADQDRTLISAPDPGADDRTRLSDRPIPAPPRAGLAPARGGTGDDGRTDAPLGGGTGGGTPQPQGPLASRLVESGVLINNNYRIQRMLSAGGMGEVYKAENVFTGDPVAVKIVLPSLASDDGIIQLFKREARILGQLNDSAIVRYHNFVLDQGLGRYCLIMEYIDGNTLWDQVDSYGPIPAAPALNLIRRLAHGLGKAHARGVTHRDLSPDNVMLRGNRLEDAVLIDFGIARAVDFGEGTLAGRFAGKFKYVSPEQLGHYGGEIGPAADVYGMALMVAAVLRGTALDMGSSAVEAVEARRGIPDLSGLPHEVYPLLQHMLEPDPKARPASMNEVALMAEDPLRIPLRYRMPLWGEPAPSREHSLTGSLTGSISGLGTAGASESPFEHLADGRIPHVPIAKTPRHRASWMPVAAAGVVAVAALGGWMLLGGEDVPPVPDPIPAEGGGDALAADEKLLLPPRDLDTREGFLADYDLGVCVQVQRIASGMDAGKLAAVSDRPVDFSPLLSAYGAAFSARPEVIAHRINADQCAAVDFVRALQGRAEPPPILSLDSTSLPEGGTVAGRVRGAQGRTIWLFLAAADGGLHDLSSRLTAQADGSFTFSFGLALQDLAEPSPQLIVALASRNPLIAPTTAAAATPVAQILPQVQAEIAAGGGFAAADMAFFELTPGS